MRKRNVCLLPMPCWTNSIISCLVDPRGGLDSHIAEVIEDNLMKLNLGWIVIKHRYNNKLFAYDV